MYVIVCICALLSPFAVVAWFTERVLRKNETEQVDALGDINFKFEQRLASVIEGHEERLRLSREENEDLLHTLQDEERSHADAELALDESEMDLAECAEDLAECEIGLAGYARVVEEQDVTIAALREELTLRDEMLNDLESTILDLRMSQAGQKKLEPIKAKRVRKAS